MKYRHMCNFLNLCGVFAEGRARNSILAKKKKLYFFLPGLSTIVLKQESTLKKGKVLWYFTTTTGRAPFNSQHMATKCEKDRKKRTQRASSVVLECERVSGSAVADAMHTHADRV